jgi:hypothetical protein
MQSKKVYYWHYKVGRLEFRQFGDGYGKSKAILNDPS